MTNLGIPGVFPQCTGDCHRMQRTRLLTGVQLFYAVLSESKSRYWFMLWTLYYCHDCLYTPHVINRSYRRLESRNWHGVLTSKCVSYQNYSHYIACTRLMSAHNPDEDCRGASCTVEKGWIYISFRNLQRIHGAVAASTQVAASSAQGTSRTALVCIRQQMICLQMRRS